MIGLQIGFGEAARDTAWLGLMPFNQKGLVIGCGRDGGGCGGGELFFDESRGAASLGQIAVRIVVVDAHAILEII